MGFNRKNLQRNSLSAIAMLFGVILLGSRTASATLVESWENTLDSWSVPAAGAQVNFAPVSAFSTTSGVTNGTYSLAISNGPTDTSSGPTYDQMVVSPATMANTTLLSTASALTLDVFAPGGSFGGFLQFQIYIGNNDADLGGGYLPLNPGNMGGTYYSANLGSETTLSFPITPAEDALFATSSSPTSIHIQVGGGYSAGNETMYLDNLQTVAAVPEPATLSLIGIGGALLLARRRRRMR